MLADPKLHSRHADPIAAALGWNVTPTRIDAGLYQINHFNFDMLLSKDGGNLSDGDEWADGWRVDWDEALPPFYGVCDSPEQFVAKYGERLRTDERRFCVSFTCVEKADQSPSGGWRWHKWGEYVGEGEPTCEYLYDEEKFERVYVFHVYVRKQEAVERRVEALEKGR